jgi:hypothetical protein
VNRAQATVAKELIESINYIEGTIKSLEARMREVKEYSDYEYPELDPNGDFYWTYLCSMVAEAQDKVKTLEAQLANL